MKIIRRRSDKSVYFLVDEGKHVALTDAVAVIGRERAIDFNDVDYEVVSGVPMPSRTFLPGLMVFDGQWVVPDEAAYAAAMPTPESVPRLAARLALINAGLWASITALIDAIPDTTQREQTKAFFEDAANWRRDDATVASLAAGLGLNDAELDQMFVAAKIIDESLGG